MSTHQPPHRPVAGLHEQTGHRMRREARPMPQFEPERAASSPNTNRSKLHEHTALAPIIGGVLEYRIEDFTADARGRSSSPTVPQGVRIRIDLGSRYHRLNLVDVDTIRYIAWVVCGAREVDIVGNDPEAVADAVRNLRGAVATEFATQAADRERAAAAEAELWGEVPAQVERSLTA